jgi:predicted amidophosphoribosyltransferase
MAFAILCLIPLLCALAGWLTLLERRRQHADARFEHQKCANCGYDIRFNLRTCPECGDDLVAQVVNYCRSRLDGRA